MLTQQHYLDAVAFVQSTGQTNTCALQRHLRLGYYQAACLMERLEENGIVSPANHHGERELREPAP